MKTLAILGASGHGKVVADMALASGYSDIVFFDDRWPELTRNELGQVLGDSRQLTARAGELEHIIVAIGDCRTRLEKHRAFSGSPAAGHLATIVHPDAVVSPHCTLGRGVVVMPGAVINACAVVGDACIVNSGAIVEHDCVLKDGVHVAPGAILSGGVQAGETCWIGAGAVVRQNMTIGSGAMIGAGAVVVRPVDENTVVAGCPAAPIAKKGLA